MTSYKSDNQRIVKNTIFLYIRTVLVLLIALFTARVLLKTLGVSDFGIYNVVGSVVILFSFLNTAMTQATQRFITFEIGKSFKSRLCDVFSMSINTQFIIMLLILILTETVGLWFLNYKLNIPGDRLFAANIAYQLSIASFCVNIIRVPFEAAVIAQERMSFFAYVSLFDSILKLLIVYFLQYISSDNLIFYTLLLLCVSIIIALMEVIYVYRYFDGFNYIKIWDKDLFKQLFTFTGWSLCGSATDVFTQKGFMFILNIYYGVIANASMGIGNQVSGALRTFINSFQTSFRPQIVKSFASNEHERFHNLILRISKFSYVLVLLPAIVLVLNMQFLLTIWLGEVPEYAADFCILLTICAVFDAVSGSFYCAILSSESIKKYQLSISVVFTLDLVMSFGMIKMGVSPHYILYSRLLTRGLLNFFVGIYFSNKMFSFPVLKYIKSVIVPITIGTIIIVIGALPIHNSTDKWIRLLASTCYVASFGSFVVYKLVFDEHERLFVKNILKKYIR